ncbi:MAG: Clp protease N-terminal domain-containing protein, partial [Arcobacteraceae bacterium]
MISEELREVFSKSIHYAKSLRHEYLTTEHVFLMLLEDQNIKDLLNEFGVNIQSVSEALATHINLSTPVLPDGIEDEPIESVKLANTIENMIAHINRTKGGNATVEDMFVSILNDEKSYAN